jgi:uncharacterized damage-inducible protein DinB
MGCTPATTLAHMDPLKIYRYLMLTRERVFDAVRPLTPEAYRQPTPIGLGSIASTLTHLMISEWYYIERLQGHEVEPYERWPIKYESPPECAVLERTWREQQQRICTQIAAECAHGDWQRTIRWLSFPDDSRAGRNRRYHITCTAGDLITQLALHEVHHRSQVMSILRMIPDVKQPLQDLDYNALMYERVEATA